MKNYRRSLILVLLAVLLLTSFTAAFAQGNGGIEAEVAGYLYVRVLPDVKADDYGRLSAGDMVTLVARTSDSEWVKLAMADGTLGWARPNALTFEGDLAGLPTEDVSRSQAVVTRFANLRANPAMDASNIGRLEQGTVVDLVAASDGFMYVAAGDVSGWVVPRGLSFVRESGSDVIEAPELAEVNASVHGFANVRVLPELDAYFYERLNPGTPVNVIGRNEDADWVQLELLDGSVVWGTTRAIAYSGDIEALPVASLAEQQAIVNNYAVLRAEPNSTSAEVGTLDRGTVVTLLLLDGNRVFVDADGLQGWAQKDALSYAGGMMDVLASNAAVSSDVTVAAVNLRKGPSADAALQGSAAKGERLAVVGVSADGDWYRVVPGSHVAAWVSADLVTLDAGVEALPVVE